MRVYASAEMTLTDTNDGISVTGIDRYYMASSSSSGITVDSQGWKPDPQETNPISRYHWSYEVVNYSSGSPVPTKPAIIGVYGDSAKMLYLSATAESMTFDADGTPNPSSQVITLTANLQNVSGNASFVATAYNGSTVVSDVVLSGAGNTRTFNQAQFPASANRVQVRATLGNLVDTVTIVKLSNGSMGQNAVVGLLTNESITLPANKDGLVPASSFTGAKGIFDVYDGITKKTDSNDVKYSVVSQSNITVSIDATGAYAVTEMPTGTAVLNGFATLSAIYNGVTIEKQLNVSKSVAGATGATGATGAQGASATSYWITASNNIIGKSQTGVINPTTITFKGFSKTGTANPVAYSGRFIIQTSTNGTTYDNKYVSSANQSSYTYTIPSDSLFVKCLFYMAGGTTVLLDEQTVPIVESAEGIQIGGVNLLRALNSNNYSGIWKVNEDGVVVRGFDGAGATLSALYKAKTSSGDHTFSYAMKEGSSHRVLIHIYDENENVIENKSISGWTWNIYYKGYFRQVNNGGSAVFNAPSETRYITGVIVPPWDIPIVDYTLLWMKLEKGNKPTAWTPAPEDARTYKAWANSADGTADFTRVYPNENLLLESNQLITTSAYGMKDYPLAGTLTATDDVVITIKGSLGADRAGFRGYNSGGSTALAGVLSPIGDGVYQTKGKWNPVGGNSFLRIYQLNSTGTSSSTIEWIKLERGTTPTIYTTNPKDSLSGSVPKYIGMSPLDSNKPEDYAWMINPEWAEAKSDEGLNGKEGAILKQPNAPTNPAVGLIWVDTTSVPNVPKRWTGTEWVKLTATEASEIGAFTESEGTELVERMNTAENIITADSITSTVLSSEDFTTLFDGKANAEDLEGMATISGVDDLLQTWSAQMKSDLGDTYNPLFTRYTELKETIDKFDFKISQAGGINMLQNSLGFSGLDFWEDTTAPGINILEGSYGDMREVTVQGWGDYRDPLIRNGNSLLGDYIQIGKTYTLSVRLATGAYSARCFIRMPKEGEPYRDFRGNDIPPNSTGISKVTFTVPEDALSAYVFSIRLDLSTTPAHTMSHGGFKLEEGSVATAWTPAPLEAPGFTGGGLTTTTQDNALASLGFGSGFVNQASGAKAIQRVELPSAGMYTLSFYMKKVTTNGESVLPVGTGGIELYLGGEKHIFIGAEKGVEVESFEKYSYTFTTELLDLEVHMVATDNEDTEVTISGIMLNIGDLALLWQPYPSEIYNTNVLVDINGITVKNNQTDGYTIITPKEFSGYANVDGNMRRIFTLNGATTEVEELEIRSKLKMGVLTVIPVTTTKNKGWAFI